MVTGGDSQSRGFEFEYLVTRWTIIQIGKFVNWNIGRKTKNKWGAADQNGFLQQCNLLR